MEESPLLYAPIQPAVDGNDQQIEYVEVFPHNDLQEFVYCYWELRTLQQLSSDFKYRVIADGCIDIFYNVDQPALCFVMGFSQEFESFDIGRAFRYAGVRFRPSSFKHLFGVNAKDLANKVKDLKEVNTDLYTFVVKEQGGDHSFSDRTEKWNTYLKSVARQLPHSLDDRLRQTLNLIYGRSGHVTVETDLKTGFSPRQLRRIFNQFIGTSPKSFCKVVRFQSVIHKFHENQKRSEPSIYLDAGFVDQAHFIKDFKQFYGVTPSEVYPRMSENYNTQGS